MNKTDTKDFNRDKKLNFMFLLNFFLFALVGIKYLILREISIAACWISASSLWFINFSWRSVHPCIRITNEELIIFRSPILRPKKIKLDTIKELDGRSAWNLKLVLLNSRIIKLPYFEIAKEDRKKLIDAINSFIPN